MANMNIAIGIRWAVMQYKFRPAFARRTNALIELAFLPVLEHQRFAFRQITAHRERRVGEIQCVFVISHFLKITAKAQRRKVDAKKLKDYSRCV